MWRSRKVRLWAIVLIAVSVAANLILYICKVSPYNLADIGIEKSVSAANVSSVRVLSNIGDVKVVVYEGAEIRAVLKGKAERSREQDFDLQITKEEAGVTIKANQANATRFLTLYSGSYDLLVQLPRKEYEQVYVETALANLRAEDVRSKQITLKTGSGNIDSSNLEGKVSVAAEEGDIRLNDSKISQDIEAKTKLGDVTVTVAEAPAALRTDLSTGLGEKILRLPNAVDGSVGTGGPLVVLSSAVGDVSLLAEGKSHP